MKKPPPGLTSPEIIQNMAKAIQALNTGYSPHGGAYRHDGGPLKAEDILSAEVRAFMAINILKTFSDAAIRTYYGSRALELMYQIENAFHPQNIPGLDAPGESAQFENPEIFKDFLDEIKKADDRRAALDETPDLPLDIEPPPPLTRRERVSFQSISKLARYPDYIPINQPNPLEVVVSPGNKKEVCITAELTIPDGVEIETNWELRRDHILIMDAFGTLWKNNHTKITLNDLSEKLFGTRQVSPSIREYLAREVETLGNIKCTIDCTAQLEEIKKRAKNNPELKSELKNAKKLFFRDRLLDVVDYRIEMQNGEIVNGYLLKSEPPTFAYSRQVREVITIPINALNAPGVKSSPESLRLRGDLIYRVAIANRFNKPQNILIDNLPMITPDLARMQRKRIAERAEAFLKHWENIGYIRKVTPMPREGGRLVGWTVYPREKGKPPHLTQ